MVFQMTFLTRQNGMVVWISRRVSRFRLDGLALSLTCQYKVKIQPEAFKYVREKFAPPSDPVFELVPPFFAEHAGEVYAQIGSPALAAATIWQVYREMIQRLQDFTMQRRHENQDYIEGMDEWQSRQKQNQDEEPDLPYPLIEGRELFGGTEREDGSIYLGGVNEGRGIGKQKTYQIWLKDF